MLNKLSSISAIQLFQLLRQGSFILIAIILAKSGIGVDQIGKFETWMLVSSLLSFFWVSGLTNGYLALFPKSSAIAQKELTTSLFTLSIYIPLFLLFLLFVSDKAFGTMAFFSWEQKKLFSLFFFFHSGAFLAEYILLAHKRSKTLILYGGFISSLLIVSFVFLYFTEASLDQYFTALVWYGGSRWIFTLLLTYHFGKASFNQKTLGSLFYYSSPLIVAILLSGSAEYVDGVLIRSYMSSEDFAIFRYGAKEFPVVLLLVNALSVGSIPLIVKDLNSGITEMLSSLKRLMHILFPLTLVFMIFSTSIYSFVFGDEFAESAWIFDIYLLLIIPRMLLPQTLLIAKGLNKIVLQSSILELTANVVLSFVFLKFWGMKGVAFATFIAFSIDKAFLFLRLNSVEGVKLRQITSIQTWLIYSILLLLAFTIKMLFIS